MRGTASDHAQLFIMSVGMTQILDPSTGALLCGFPFRAPGAAAYFPDCDLHEMAGDWHRRAATNIYRTRDGRYYHIHACMNPAATQTALGLPEHAAVPAASLAEAAKPYAAKVAQMEAAPLDRLINEHYRQAGTVCYSVDEYRASEHGRANAHVGLYEVHSRANPRQSAAWWPTPPGADPKRPLFGLKVVELARVIAGPCATRELAEMGASVMRVAAPHIADVSTLFPDLSWGKWNSHLDLREEADRATLRALVMDADVVLDGYRPGVMEKWGFGQDDVLRMRESSERGIVHVRANCYGWHGPWAGRSGLQQISDAVSRAVTVRPARC